MTLTITHMSPPDGFGKTPCCDKTPFELPRYDRLTNDRSLVTCIEQLKENNDF